MTNQEKISQIINKLYEYYKNEYLFKKYLFKNKIIMKFCTTNNSEMTIDISFSEYENTKHNIDIDLKFFKILKIYKDDSLNECLFEIPLIIIQRPMFSYINQISDETFVEDVFQNIKNKLREYNKKINDRFELIRDILSEKIMKESDKLKEIFTDKEVENESI